ncbi:LOW QUALITY PROTEIN: kelch-like protein 10 [Haliotis rubra]|uniref:LOW QUALITY PROTEIN: kelch-like protein 10 n=1 Tax=Haliotis rubra TaxID=36100 RepID=UPI001EE5C990|nr:LOW QUALITY PROTEIN: kelch-like protein 10 [Haliotis rubra]
MSEMDIEDETTNGTVMQKKFSVHACNVLSELRKKGELCDAVIRVEDTTYKIHRAIMSACSPYFRALFTNQMFDTNKREVTIPGVSPDIMHILIEYAYTRDIKIDRENVEQLLPAADQFHVTGLVRLCCDFLLKEMCAENVIGIRAFARAYFCHSLERHALRFLLQHIGEVYSNSNEFLQLDVEEVCEILGSDDLNVKNEEIVFDAVLRWIDFDPEKRKCQIARLLKTIRLGLLTTQYFVEKVKSHPYVKEIDACKPIIIETLKFLYDLDMDEDKEVDLNNPLAKPRVPHEILFVIGGWSGGSPTNMVETYDTRADRWIVSNNVDTGPRAYHGTVALDQHIYVIGGFDGMEYFNSVRVFNPINSQWTEAAPMNAKRCYVSVAVLDKFIYAMGGFDGHVRQNTAERYLKKNNQWSLIQPMNHQRSDASATTLEGKIYICGGFNGQECLNTAECFDPNTNQWTLITPMRNRRSGVGVIAYRGCVYALGGFNGITRMNTGERFNPQTNTWQTIPEMYNPRSNFAIEVIDDMIFSIGGFNGVTTIFNVECYDASTDEWYDATDMNLYRSALSACVVKGLPNVQDFIHKERDKDESKRKKTN